ncbi:MAG: C13 family peptidase [Candidatus Thorarchaeota archaeon]
MNKQKSGLILLAYIILSNFQYLLVNSGGNMSYNQFNTNSNIFVKASDVQYECIDAWIIIGGDKSNHHAWDLVLLTLEWVYDQALAFGNTDDEILMLVPLIALTSTTREYGVSSPSNINYAFTTWAPNKVGPNGVLAVYLHDHGGTDAMANYPFSSLTASQLDQYLDDFEAASGCNRIIVVYEACSSGSFLDELSQSDRIIMTSTEPGYSAYWSPIPPHISLFGEGLFKSILAGNSIGDAFVDAANEINALGYGDIQKPCIDDNHDGMGHIVNAWGQLPSTGDGIDAKNTFLFQGCPPILIQAPKFLFVPLKFWMAYNPTIINFPISIRVDNSTEIASVICRVLSEDWIPPEPRDNESMGLWDENEDSYQWELTLDGDGNFTGRVAIVSPILDSDYTLSFFAEDLDGRRSQIISTQVGINEDGIAPIDIVDPTVKITNPNANAGLSGIFNITVEGDDDQALDKIQIYLDSALLKEEKMPDYYPYPTVLYSLNTEDYSSGRHNITARALDNANNIQDTSILVTFEGEDKIPGFQIPYLFIGALIGVITIITLYVKRNSI